MQVDFTNQMRKREMNGITDEITNIRKEQNTQIDLCYLEFDPQKKITHEITMYCLSDKKFSLVPKR